MMEHLELLLIIGICFSSPCAINAATDPSDAAALNVMYTTMNSPSQLTGWSSSGNDPCGQNWKGVTCSGSRVTEIKLPSLGLSGSLGYQLSSLTSVTEFDVSSNNLADLIPYQLPPNVQRLNLASNNFNGAIPYSISLMTSLIYLNISHNQLNQQLVDMFQKLPELSTLDLSFCQIPGPLPASFSSLTSMNSMYLQNNQFKGTIDVLSGLPLDNLNVANNQFTGWIPQTLQNINLQKNGNSWSSDPAPPSHPGTPPFVKSKPHTSMIPTKSDHSVEKKSGISGGTIAGIIISLLVVGAMIAFFLVKRRSIRSGPDVEKAEKQDVTPVALNGFHEAKPIQSISSMKAYEIVAPLPLNLKPPPLERYKSFDEDSVSSFSSHASVPTPVVAKKPVSIPSSVKSYSVANLQMATESFSVDNLLGEGYMGCVYRAEFDDGKVLAVKKVDSAVISNCLEDFTEIVANISRLHHSNVSELVGYCSEHGQHLLVYEFHKNGSLYDFLHHTDEYSKPLTWNTRVKIALGSARALEYLHEVCSPSVVHKNFKSENILLDGEMNPHVSDCGLSNLVQDASQAINHNACAPEVADSGQYSLKSDIYSFGVVMLELLTGRKASDSSRTRSEQSLVRWATPQLHDIDALTKMVDPALEGVYPVKSLSRFADVVALCVQPEPEFRPPMSEVVQALVRLVQRANMSKRTVGIMSQQSANSDESVS